MQAALSEFPLTTPFTKRLLVIGSTPRFPSTTPMMLPGYEVLPCSRSALFSEDVRALLPTCDVVLLDATDCGHDALPDIQKLSASIGIGGLRPRLLCYSTIRRNAQFILRIQKLGARYVRITDADMLVDAIELIFAELRDLECNGPSFQVVHEYSRGICTPGEEISAIFLDHSSSRFQLALGLSERFLFDFLAQRRIAKDSLQIVSGLSADRFYREHAANSGVAQRKTIRRPTVKVLIQRIRNAMDTTFSNAQLTLDPRDVLRSCLAESSNRVLYRLDAHVTWFHRLLE